MDQELYDEFGNYIGPEMDDSDEELESEEEAEQHREDQDDGEGRGGGSVGFAGPTVGASNALAVMDMDSTDPSEGQIVLHEDKNYYPGAEEVYPGVNTVLLDEDAQDLSEPILKPVKSKTFSVLDDRVPDLTVSPAFTQSMLRAPQLSRNLAVVGHLHHGKTLFMDILVGQTLAEDFDPAKEVRYTDSRKDEQDREMSIKATPVSLVLASSSGKSHLLNMMDCPGHPCFSDEASAGMRAADGVVLVVDAVEGVMMNTTKMVEMACLERLPITLVVNKVDRLILELKIPPNDAYYKLVHTIEDVNSLIAKYWVGDFAPASSSSLSDPPRVSPEYGNVCFASAAHGWCFSLGSFAKIYTDYHAAYGASSATDRKELSRHKVLSAHEFSIRLWGDAWLDPETRTFKKVQPSGSVPRTFVEFILEPLYKVYASALGEEPDELARTLRDVGVKLSKPELHLDPKPLLRLILSRFFGNASGFVDMVATWVPSPVAAARGKVAHCYTGELLSDGDVGLSSAGNGATADGQVVARAMAQCDPAGPLVMNVVKLYSSPDGTSFHALGRVYSGTLRAGDRVRVLGESYSLDDEEDMAHADAASLSLGQGRYRMDLPEAYAGNWVLVEGIDAPINKTATVAAAEASGGGRSDGLGDLHVDIFRPLRFNAAAVLKLAVEPLNPAELPKMVEGLRRISKAYPLAGTKVEESGEHVVMGTGELYLDCIMHDLREVYSDIEVKVADPCVAFCETVVETSQLKCFSETPNKRNKLTMIAEPLEEGLAEDIESGEVSIGWEKRQLGDFFQQKYDWDLLAARSIWAFGPDAKGPNVLVDDTLPSEVDKKLLGAVRDSVVQGFQWGCREGPLCDEPVRNAKFKILDATIAAEPIHRGGGQIIPTARRVAYSSFLMASPRLMEPIFELQVRPSVRPSVNLALGWNILLLLFTFALSPIWNIK